MIRRLLVAALVGALAWSSTAAPARADVPATAPDGGSEGGAGAPPPRFAPHPAAPLDAVTFSHRAPLTVPAAPEGVSRLRLSPLVLAAARVDLGDLRVIDSASRQWPYVLADNVGTEALDLQVSAPRVEAGRSRYALGLPASPAILEELTLQIDRDFFDRAYRLVATLASGGDETLATGRLDGAARVSGWLRVPLPRARVRSLTLVVDDGDEAPLPLTAARGTFPVADLWLVAPAGRYSLVVGDPEARLPRYEIATRGGEVRATDAPPIEAGALAPNAGHRPREARPQSREQLALWAALVLAVGVLGALTLRLARHEEQEDEAAVSRKSSRPPPDPAPPT